MYRFLLMFSFLPYRIREWIYIRCKMKIGSGTLIGRGFHVDHPNRVSIGSESLINYNCHIYCGGTGNSVVTIGDRTQIGYETKIFCGTHEIGNHDKRAGKMKSLSVHIGNGVWIGGGATILPGVTIHDGCIIGAGAVVTRDCEKDGLYVGNPAVRKKDLR